MVSKVNGVKLKRFKDLMVRFGNSRQQFFFSQKRGSIAIEGAVCTMAVFVFLGMMINIFEVYNQALLAVRLTDNLAMSLFNGRNSNQVFLQGLVDQVMAANGVKGASATVNSIYISGSWNMRTFNYGAGCQGPSYGQDGNGIFLTSMIGQHGGSGDIFGYYNMNSLAQVAVCVPPPPFYLNWAFFGGPAIVGYNAFTQPQSAIAMVGIPNPPKHK